MRNCTGIRRLPSSDMHSSFSGSADRRVRALPAGFWERTDLAVRALFPAAAPRCVLVILLAAGILIGQAAESGSAANMFPKLGYDQIELRRTGENHLFLFGQVNGRKQSCLVDTGWSFTTLQADQQSSVTNLEILNLGRTTFTNQPARAEKVLFNSQPAAFDLVLGLDFLRRNFALLDCGRRRLFTRREALSTEAQGALETALRGAGFREVELRLKAAPALTVAARVNGEPLELLLDSGAVWSCVDQRQVARLKMKPMPSAARITGAGATSQRSVAVAEVKSLLLGEVELKDKTVALFDLADWGFAAPDKALSEVQGILGGDLLAATGAVIDCHRLKLWLKPARHK